jgi:hypothetical protein
MSRHSNGQVRDAGSSTGKHGIASAAAVLLRTDGKTPESVAGFLRQAAGGNGNIPVPAPRNSEDTTRQVSSS